MPKISHLSAVLTKFGYKGGLLESNAMVVVFLPSLAANEVLLSSNVVRELSVF